MKFRRFDPRDVTEPWEGSLVREGWIYGFGMAVACGQVIDPLLQAKMDWCKTQFGPATTWLRTGLRLGHFSDRDWSRYGRWFLFIDQDMAFEFRMRWS